MKTKPTPLGRFAGLAVAIALFTVAATPANAQEKGGTRLTQLNASKAVPVAIATEHKVMSCAKCQDQFVVVADADAKGAGARALATGGTPTKIVAKHLCGSCSNEWVVRGHGKAKLSFPIHKCASCG